MTLVSDILAKKGSTVWTVTPKTTVFETLKLMSERNVGAVLVLDGGKISGIFSERDFARHAVKETLQLKNISIEEMMTTRILFVGPSQTTDECMSLMTAKRIRHLPVIENDKLVGLISIGDVVSKVIEDHKFSISQLERYVTGEY
jgi:CBS domain-containing protein